MTPLILLHPSVAIVSKAEESMVLVSYVWSLALMNCYQELQSKLMAARAMVTLGLFWLVVLLFHSYRAFDVLYLGHNQFG